MDHNYANAIQKLETKLQQTEDENDWLSVMVNVYKSKVKTLIGQLYKARNDIDRLTKELQSSNETNKELTEELAMRESIASSLQDDVDHYRNDRDMWKADYFELKTFVDELKDSLLDRLEA
jgi:chromosome segregation ATPase